MDGSAKRLDRKALNRLIEHAAREVLNSILVTSIERRREYGGMIYLQGGRCHATTPVTQDNPTTVDVGQQGPNRGCPPNTIPLAYYHTHPTYSVGGFRATYETFSPEDKSVADDWHIDAYLGTLDGSFLKYDWQTKAIRRLRGHLKNASQILR